MNTTGKIAAVIEARMSSSRLPGKVLKEINGKPVLQILTERLSKSKFVDEVIIATTINEADDEIEILCKRLDIKIFRGSEEDVLGRVTGAAESVNADVIVEITGDCPLIDAEVVDNVVSEYLNNYPKYDYVTNIGYVNNAVREIPVGMDVRVFSYKELKKISELTDDPEDREHVSLYFFRTGKDIYKLHNVNIPDKWKRNYDVRLTLDTTEDFELISLIYNELIKTKPDFNLEDILNFADKNRKVLEINSYVIQKKVKDLD
ncbi:MAG TPA: glycosyltransferase family protein [Ignavibacteria bacterium]|nr:glycosyltransferase family protein [Ignavibacteria bacterium]